nr:Sterol O-acyltransferase 1 [Polyrhizophydium stewartii]
MHPAKMGLRQRRAGSIHDGAVPDSAYDHADAGDHAALLPPGAAPPPAHPGPDHARSAEPDRAVTDRNSLQRSLAEQFSQLEQLQITAQLMSSNVTKELSRITNELEAMKTSCAARICSFDSALASSGLSTKHGRNPGPKCFVPRDSLLSVMLHVKDFMTVYNIFVAVLPIVGITAMLQNYAERGRLIDFSLMTYTFGSIDIVAQAWVVMFAWTAAGYAWKHINAFFPFPVVLPVYIAYQGALYYFAAYMAVGNRLPPASGCIVLCEQTRLSMKVHSFFRKHLPTNSEPAETVYQKNHGGVRLYEVGFSHYMASTMAPCAYDRTEYPRTPLVRWSRAILHALEFSFIITYAYILFERYLFPILRVPPVPEKNSMWEFLFMSFNCMVPSMILFVFGFFGFLHSWLNMWAEILQFADREFYNLITHVRDWWNSLSFAEYYRKWNAVVYDWLYEYMYADTVMFLEQQHFKPMVAKSLAALFVIEVSAVIHEHILACALGFFFPVLLLMFGGPGVVFTHFTRKRKDQNVFVWAMLFVGCGLLVTLYSREFYFRQLYVDKAKPWTLGDFTTSYAWRHIINAR